MRAAPVAVPLTLELPTLDVSASVLGVGITRANAMAAPVGPKDDPVWGQAFWYRGSAIPGARSTALLAGHVGGSGTDGVFVDIDELVPGDPIIVRDTRNGLKVRFAVTESISYPLDRADDDAILRRIYGAGPVEGTWSQPSADGLAHLTLVTCAGTYKTGSGTHDHRLVVYATRVA